MKLRAVALSAFVIPVVTLAGLVVAQAPSEADRILDYGPVESLVIESETGEHSFTVEVADTLAEQAQGMMYRTEMADDAGMLFEFEEPKVATIWMKNTAIPLDILFVRANGRILKIEHMAQPYKLRSASSEAPVVAVLELKGGTAENMGIMPGDVIRHEYFRNTG